MHDQPRLTSGNMRKECRARAELKFNVAGRDMLVSAHGK
jgi:hypothetical protein